MIRSFTELNRLHTLEDRFDYLQLGSQIGAASFGADRWVNQQFYRSAEWRHIRDHVIARDLGFDLGMDDVPIMGAPAVHHMNPMTLADIEDGSFAIIDPEYLITTSLRTHNAIHFGDRSLLPKPFVERSPGDTRLW